MTTLKPQDLQWVLQRIPRHVLQAIKDSNGRVFVAGGFIRSCIANEPPNDIDMFVSSKIEAKGLAEQLALVFRHTTHRHRDQPRYVETDNAFTISGGYRTPLQIIHRWTFNSPRECVESFDFTIARAAVWWGLPPVLQMGNNEAGWQSVCDDDFYADLAAKRLVYKSPIREEEAGGSMLRVLKFYQRGFRIPLDSLGAVMARMFVHINVDPRQVAIMDQAQFERHVAPQLTEMLREVDPALDPDHIAHLPSMKE